MEILLPKVGGARRTKAHNRRVCTPATTEGRLATKRRLRIAFIRFVLLLLMNALVFAAEGFSAMPKTSRSSIYSFEKSCR